MERAFVAVCVAMLCSAACREPDLFPEPAAGSGGVSGTGGTGGEDLGENQPDPCKIDNGGCFPRVRCSVVDGRASCGSCPQGYRGDGTRCEDIDECAAGSDDCDDAPNACKNDMGSFHCECPSGYSGVGRGSGGCNVSDACTSGTHDCNARARCVSGGSGGFSCECPSGFAGDGRGPSGCTDIDECAAGACGEHRSCTDSDGSYSCGACDMGYASSADTGPCSEFWPQRFSTGSEEEIWAITTDKAGNVYITGFTAGALDDNTSAGGSDIILVKYDAAGQKQWARQLGTSSADEGYGVATDANGAVYVVGYTEGGLDGYTNQGGADIVLLKYDAAGQKQWSKQLGTASHDYGAAIRTDASGHVIITGSTDGALDGNASAGGSDLFLMQYDAAGESQWSRQLGTGTDEEGSALAIGPDGSIYVSGFSDGALDGNTRVGGIDMIVVKFDAAGQKQWTRQLGSPADDTSTGIATDASGNAYISGWTDGALDGNTSAGDADIVVSKLDSAGQKQWTRQVGSSSYNVGLSIASDGAGNVYITGVSDGALPGATSSGGEDLFVLKYDSAGQLQWTRQRGTSNSDYGNALTCDASGHVYVTGAENSTVQGTDAVGGSSIVIKYDAAGSEL